MVIGAQGDSNAGTEPFALSIRWWRRVLIRFLVLLAATCGVAASAVTCQSNLSATNPDGVYLTQNFAGTPVVTDTRTGLMWKRDLESGSFTWPEALARAATAADGGYADWRLPSLKELLSLVERCRINPAINDSAFPSGEISYVWTGSPNVSNDGQAWYVEFLYGTSYFGSRGNGYAVRLVRGGSVTSGNISTLPLGGLLYPHKAISDTAGNIYVSDTDHSCVKKVTPAGAVTIFAGTCVAGFSGDGGPATAAELNGVYGLVFDSTGNLYIADRLNRRIRRVALDGTISTFAGTGSNAFGGDGGAATLADLADPVGLAIDASDRLYIADLWNQRVRRVASGVITTFAGSGVAGDSGDGGPATAAQLNQPVDVAVDGAGVVYISDRVNARVRRVSLGGTIDTIIGAPSVNLNNPDGLAAAQDGTIYVPDRYGHRVLVRSPAGVVSVFAGTGAAGYSGDGGPATLARLQQPTGISVDPWGNVLIGDTYNHVIRKVGGIPPVDTTPPTLNAITATVATLTATSNEAATGYWIVVARGATAPTAAQVKAGVMYSSVTVLASGSGAMAAGTPTTFNITGLNANILYDFYVVAEDAAGNASMVAKGQNTVDAACVSSTVATIEFMNLSASMTANAVINLGAGALRTTFNVTCANGRFGVVRLPKTVSGLLGGDAYALVQSSCATKPVQRMASPPATVATVAAALSKKSSQVDLLNDALVGPLAGWVCE